METKKEIIISYTGQLKYETIGQLINELKMKVSDLEISIVLYKKILLVMIESLENIMKYNEHFEKDITIKKEYPPVFNLDFENNKFILTSSNAILNTDVPDLHEKLNLITHLDNEGLKKLYKNTITNGQFSEKGGAGLGFIEMAKIASRKMNYSFTKINRDYSYYRLEVVIDKEPYKN